MSGYIYKKINSNETIIKNRSFPSNINKYKCKNGISLIGVGGNLGDCKRRFEKLLIKFKRDKLVKVLSTSIIYKNPPFGYLEQAPFYNTIILIDTKLNPLELLRYTQSIEKIFRRKREFKDAPRTLDLDIIFYNKRVVKIGDRLIIPHPSWSNRESILLPLTYLKGAKCLTKVL